MKTIKNTIKKGIKSDILKLLKHNEKKSWRAKLIAKHLKYSNEHYRVFHEVLEELQQTGQIESIKKGLYRFKRKARLITGTLSINPQGFGFLDVEGKENDYFVPPKKMGTGLHGDEVEVALIPPRHGKRHRPNREEVEVTRVINRKKTQWVGTFYKRTRFAFFRPDDPKMLRDFDIPFSDAMDAEDGQKVLITLTAYKTPKSMPQGKVIQVLGDDSADLAVLSIALEKDVKIEFPEAVVKDAEAIEIEISDEEISRRLDLRKKPIFTIDPVDAKDFDDAIHLIPLENGNFELGVHIADVSHYVQPDTALDTEAFSRANSTYLVDRVIPMLPEVLSNKVCSLRPHEDKLTFSCIFEITKKGKVVSYKIAETIIHSIQRFTYGDAQEIIEGGNTEHQLFDTVQQAAKLSEVLTKKRFTAGAIDFDKPEIRIVLDDSGHPIDIIRKERQRANRMIEEFMLLANRTVSEHIGQHKNLADAFVYRNHGKPDAERIQSLAEHVAPLGHELEISPTGVTPKALNKLLTAVRGKPEAAVIDIAVLRSMSKAVYSAKNIGHFGLGFKHYSHFTSPIRRYPDLIVHRLLKRYASGKGAVNKTALEQQCNHCSTRERAAEEAERESVKLKQVVYVRDYIGEEFDGVITGVTSFGIFVELNALLVEGLVHITELPRDNYHFDENSFTLKGYRTGRTLKLGDPVRVKVVAANVQTRKIDFHLVD